jgi:putative ABC transport system permease protein
VTPFGGVVHDLSLEDFRAISRVPGVRRAAPISAGTEEVRAGERARSVAVLGTTAEFADVRRIRVSAGRFLAPGDPDAGGNEMVLGVKAAAELFAADSPLGQVVRVGSWRFRVVGVLEPRGRGLMSFDFDDLVFIPVRTAMRMFNRPSLFRLLVDVPAPAEMEPVKGRILALMRDRHRADDVTVFTQDAMLAAFSSIMNALTLALGAIASVSLVVAGVGIMNVMLVSVAERRAEIGLLKALGARDRQVLAAFLAEATALSVVGGLIGLAAGFAAIVAFRRFYPSFPAMPPDWAIAAALVMSVLVGVAFGVWPARRATRLDPVLALARR